MIFLLFGLYGLFESVEDEWGGYWWFVLLFDDLVCECVDYECDVYLFWFIWLCWDVCDVGDLEVVWGEWGEVVLD